MGTGNCFASLIQLWDRSQGRIWLWVGRQGRPTRDEFLRVFSERAHHKCRLLFQTSEVASGAADPPSPGGARLATTSRAEAASSDDVPRASPRGGRYEPE